MCEPVLLTSHQLQNNFTQLFTQAGMLSQAICGKNSPTEDEEKSKLSVFHFFSLGSSRLREERGVEWVKKIRVNGVLDPIASPSKISKNQRIQIIANHPQLNGCW